MGKIIGFSGKLGSGKTSARNWMFAQAFRTAITTKDGTPLTPRAYVNELGKLMIGVGPTQDEEFNLDSRDPQVQAWLHVNVFPFVKTFSCAEPLKNFCTDVLGLSEESVWGTDQQKNQPTHLMWDNIPTYDIMAREGPLPDRSMTGREVLEYFGSNIIRKWYQDAWANSLKNMIVNYGSEHSIIHDIRFPNEIDVITELGGYVVRLPRVAPGAEKNTHISNTALDDYDWNKPNLKLLGSPDDSLEEMLDNLEQYLLEIKWFTIAEPTQNGN